MNKFLLAILFLINLVSCSGEDKKEDKMLDVFKESGSGLATDYGVHPDIDEMETSNTASQKSSNEILGINKKSEQIEKKEIPLASNSNLDLANHYEVVLKIDFTPIDIHKISKVEFLIIGPYNVLSLNLNSRATNILLNKEIFKDKTRKELSLITASYVRGPEDFLIGLSNGEVYEYSAGTLTQLQGGPAYSGDRVNVISEFQDKIIVGSKGVYLWDMQLKNFMSDADSKRYSISSIYSPDDNSLLFLTSNSLLRLNFPEKSMDQVFTPLKSESPMMSFMKEGKNVLVGNVNGILRLSSSGSIISRFAYGFAVSKLFPLSEKDFLVLTDKGPGVLRDDEIYVDNKLGGGRATSIQGLSEKEFLIGLNTGEIVKIDVENFIQSSYSKSSVSLKETYPNACHAYSKLIKSPFSQQVSSLEINSERYVFFEGRQVCPNGIGFMDKIGSALVYKDGALVVSKDGVTATIKIPEEVTQRKLTSLLMTEEKKIFIGTEKGLFESGEKAWGRVAESSELLNDYVTDIVEDLRGNVWVSTRVASSDSEEEVRGYSPLHVKVGDAWAHFGAQNGINALGISDLSAANGELFIASPRGVSVIKTNAEIENIGRTSGLKKFIVEALSRDRWGRIWISSGFFLDGISWIDGDSVYSVDEKRGLFANRISRIAVDAESRIWIMDSAGKVGVYDYESLIDMSEKSSLDFRRVSRTKFLP